MSLPKSDAKQQDQSGEAHDRSWICVESFIEFGWPNYQDSDEDAHVVDSIANEVDQTVWRHSAVRLLS